MSLFSILLFLVLGLSFNSIASSENRPDLTATLQTKNYYKVGEEIIVNLTLKNTGDSEVTYGLPPFFEQPDYEKKGRVFFQNGEIVIKGKKSGLLNSPRVMKYVPVGARQITIVLKPNETYETKLNLTKYFKFEPDEYEIYFENDMNDASAASHELNWIGKLRSNSKFVEVVPKG